MNDNKYAVCGYVSEETFRLFWRYCESKNCTLDQGVKVMIDEYLAKTASLTPPPSKDAAFRDRINYLFGRVHENSDRVGSLCRKIEKLEEQLAELEFGVEFRAVKGNY